jgi:hypothetical protein
MERSLHVSSAQPAPADAEVEGISDRELLGKLRRKGCRRMWHSTTVRHLLELVPPLSTGARATLLVE